jgi:hypothetical protein
MRSYMTLVLIWWHHTRPSLHSGLIVACNFHVVILSAQGTLNMVKMKFSLTRAEESQPSTDGPCVLHPHRIIYDGGIAFRMHILFGPAVEPYFRLIAVIKCAPIRCQCVCLVRRSNRGTRTHPSCSHLVLGA